MSKYVFDLDHTLCDPPYNEEEKRWMYFEAEPFRDRIEVVNKLWEAGHHIIVETARGCDSKINYYERTFDQLRSWGLKFHTLRTGVKFSATYYIDDKAINSEDFFDGQYQ
tara:strand:+ start:2189 stop:2518 length:330 start_codon:yes stop_codon:yes gene_type:complete